MQFAFPMLLSGEYAEDRSGTVRGKRIAHLKMLLQQPRRRPLQFDICNVFQNRRKEIFFIAMALICRLQRGGGLVIPRGNLFPITSFHIQFLRHQGSFTAA